MNNPDLISILLPVLNGQDSISNAINSILKQSHTNFELIIINDGSTDNTEKIISEYTFIDNRIKIITNPKNIGIVKSLNLGIDFSNGLYIARQDADDYSHPLRLEIMLNALKKSKYDLLSSTANYRSENINVPHYINNTNLIIKDINLNRGNPIVHGSILAKSLVLKENKFDENIRLIEDFELWYRLQNSGYKLGIIKLPLYNYKTQLYQSKYFEQYLIYLEVTKKNKQLILLKNLIFVAYFKKLYELSVKFYMKSLVKKNFLISFYYQLLSIIIFPFKLL